MVLRNLTNYDIDVTVGDIAPGIWPTENNPGQLAGHYPSGSLRMHQIDIGNASAGDLFATFTFSWMDHGSHLNDVWRWRAATISSDGVNMQSMDPSAGKVQVMTWYDANYTYINATLLPAGIPLTDWMSKLPASTRLSSLSIPGTHDSGTYAFSGPEGPWVWTQEKTFTKTLEEGCRAFDIRLGPEYFLPPPPIYPQ